MLSKFSVAVALLTYTAFLTTLVAAQQNADRCIATNLNNLNQNFTKNLHQLIAAEKPHDNVIYSPISLHTILALAYTGASGRTADELRAALGLPTNKTLVYQQFDRLMKSRQTDNMELQMANKLYFKKGLKITSSFRKNAKRYFDAEIERVRFTKNKRTANKINQWVAKKTNNKIRDLVSPDYMDEETLAMLVNAIYLKAKWAKEFSLADTSCKRFRVNKYHDVSVEMMDQLDFFNYADLSQELGASVLQLPYADSDLSMLLVLPDDVEGLAEVESRLQDIDLRKLPQRMRIQEVMVLIPKFRIELELDIKEILKKLQIKSLFKSDSELAGIFGKLPASVSDVKHRAFIEVNEAGSEAAAATFLHTNEVAGANTKLFRVDHPFMFAIISPQAVYFVGHIVSPPLNCKIM